MNPKQREKILLMLFDSLATKRDDLQVTAVVDVNKLVENIEAFCKNIDKSARLSELDWALSRLNTFGKETDSQALTRAVDEINDNIETIIRGDDRE